MQITISKTFHDVCPKFIGGAILAEVKNSATTPELWAEIERIANVLRNNYTTDTIKEQSGIAATREAYRRAGKDPSRYRPACEQLARRILQGKDLYSIDQLVDFGNLVSLYCGYSTAMLDAEKILGENITLGIGTSGEPYEGIGRGVLNIENLPVYRDVEGGFATPTSDSVRTMISADTKRILLLINGYDGNEERLTDALNYAYEGLKRFVEVKGDVQKIKYTYA
ncbi:MAG: phenylalanine--tRNA ligase beta subunit-related protein [Prevotellamassilia sp.]|nr:phenylalanine--tRNA ligase beta subunit-related protein [Prevotellamassilia sp.]